jgi:replicative DNA helicase
MSQEQQITVTASTPTFGTYGKQFQEKIMQALLSDKRWAEQMTEVLDVSYFDLNYLHYLAEKYFSYSKKYKEFPTLQLLVTIIKDDLKNGTDILLRDQVIDYLQRVRLNPDPGDLPFVKENSLDFCRKQALKVALEEAIDLASTAKYENIVDVIRKAVSVGTAPSLGHDFTEDLESRFIRIKRDCVPTGIEELDRRDILNGGLGRGELGVVCAATGVGKSHFLIQMGSSAIKAGKNVLHYTFELSEALVGTRYDSHLCDTAFNDVMDRKADIIEKYKNMKIGKLIIKEFPMNTCTVQTIRAHIERLSLKGFVPDLIVIDYADIMRSSRQFDSLRHELKLIYEELRSYATELQLPIWTASQTNRDASQSDVVGLESMAEAYGKAMVADVVITISRKSMEKSLGYGRLFVAKNRAGRDGLVYPLKIDTSKSMFSITGEVSTPQEEIQQNEASYKQRIKEKFRECELDKLQEKQAENKVVGD